MSDGLDDADAVGRVLDGDSDSYAILVRRHQESLFRQALAMVLDPDTAADMVQDSFVRAFEGLGGCENRSRFRLWVGRILRNRCLDHLKSAATRRNQPLDQRVPWDGNDPSLQSERGEISDTIRAALASLPPDQREAFLLKHVEDRSYEEIAELCGASVSAMKMRVHRAREALRERLEASGIDPGPV